MKLEKKTIIELVIALVVVVLIGILGFVGYKYYLDKDDATEESMLETKANCEELKLITPEKVSAPTIPVLESKLNKNSKVAKSICSWSIDGKPSHLSTPMEEKCIFGEQVFNKPGNYKVSLEVKDNSCNLSKEININ